jgi:hypothetical protein
MATEAVTFETTLSAIGRNTGVEVPSEAMAALGVGQRPAVVVNVNGYEYRTTVAVMGGKTLVGVSAAIRETTGLKGGDPITVTLTLDHAPRVVEVPADLQLAFAENPKAAEFFGTLSNSLQRYHIDNVNGAKTVETRARRVAKAIELFLAGKQR